MTNLDVFADESGNTGDAAKLTSAYGGQPSFALVGVGEPSGSQRLAGIVQRLRQKHHLQAPELKSRSLARHPRLGLDLVEALLTESCPIFIELMDKQFYLSTNIVSFFLGRPWLDMRSEECRLVANGFADLLTTEIEMECLAPYLAFAQAPTSASLHDFASGLQCGLLAATRSARDGTKAGLALMLGALADAMSCYREWAKDDPTACTRMLPPPDVANRVTRYAMLPHVNAFTNLYPRANRCSAAWDAVGVVHDEQQKIDMILQDYATSFETNAHFDIFQGFLGQDNLDYDFSLGKVSLSFARSHGCAGIQLADLLAGVCTRRLNWLICGQSGPGEHYDEARLLGELNGAGVGLNMVSTEQRVRSFYSV